MVGSVGDGVKHRFATFWDTTSIVQLALYGLLAQLAVRRLERTARDQGLHYL